MTTTDRIERFGDRLCAQLRKPYRWFVRGTLAGAVLLIVRILAGVIL